MAKFEYRGITFRVGEMSRKQALECSNAFAIYLESIKGKQDESAVQREIDYLFAVFAPSSVFHNGDMLKDGSHTLDIGDGDTLALELPLTRSGFEALPVSLAALWAATAEECNGWLVNHFLDSLMMTAATILARPPASVLSSN